MKKVVFRLWDFSIVSHYHVLMNGKVYFLLTFLIFFFLYVLDKNECYNNKNKSSFDELL